MKKKNSVLRKVLAVSLAAAMLAGTGFTAVGSYVGTSVSVSAAEFGDFQYYENNNTITIFGYTGNDSEVVIPGEIDGKKVTNIAFGFSGNKDLTSVIIPDSVVEIGSLAFADCTHLNSVEIPESVKKIGSAFSGCIGLETVSLKCRDSISLFVQTFENCPNLKNIEISSDIDLLSDNVTYGSGSYSNKINLNKIFPNCEYVKISSNSVKINNNFFANCSNLKHVEIPNSVLSIGGAAFDNCTSLTDITIPNSVTSIGSAFSGCTGLTSITIPNSVKSLDGTFNGCTELTDITLSNNMISIGRGTFKNCKKLKNIKIPNGVVSIGSSYGGMTFENCQSITKIEIPDSVTFLEQAAFINCTGLQHVVIGNGLTSILNQTFYGCSNLNNIEIGSNVTSISSKAFYNCPSLTSIVIPENVTQIEQKALGYYYDSGLSMDTTVDNFTIYGKKGSVAEKYAKANNMLFVELKDLENNSELNTSQIALGGTVNIFAKADGGIGDYTYAVFYKKKAGSKWTTKQDFGTNDAVTIKPANATDYDICIKVKDGSGKIVKKYFELKVNPKLANTSTISAENITLGQQITVNGLAQGGMGEYQYQVVYKQTSQSKWTTAQAFSENATVTFKPAKATTYDVCVKVKDRNGTIIKKFFTVQVNAKLTNTSAISAIEIKKGNTVTVNGSATGGAGDYTYAVFYKQKAQSKWTTKQDFNENSIVSVKPAQATDYDICVKVKDKDGTIVKKYFIVTVTK